MIANYEVVFPDNLEQFNNRKFFWPIPRNEIESFRDQFILNYYTFLLCEEKQSESARVVPVIIDFVGQVLRCYYVQALVTRSYAANLRPLFSNESEFANRFLQNKLSVELSGTTALRRGLRKQSFIRKNASLMKSKLSKRIIKKASISSVKRNKYIVTTATGELITEHAKVDRPTAYLGLENWFSNDRDYNQKFVEKLPSNLIDGIMEIVEQTFNSHDEQLSDMVHSYLYECLVTSFEEVNCYIGSLLLDHEYIPKELWRGTGGLIWNRILSFCTQELGGKVTGHDHSHGQGAWMSNSDQIIEYPYCDTFYVWTRNQKLRCVDNISPKLAFGFNTPAICAHSDHQVSLGKEIFPSNDGFEISGKIRIMYVGTVYSIDRITYSLFIQGYQ